MAAPIELRLSPQKPRLVVGEGIILNLEVRVLSSTDLVSLELNRNRTSIRVEPRNGGPPQVLTGVDYLRVHKVSPLAQIEDAYHANAGAVWTVGVELLNYSAPLPAGVYSISLSYRYGEDAGESVATNATQVEVTPAELASAAYRWFGGASHRDLLGCVWTARNADGEHWCFQGAASREPGALQFATGIGNPARRPGAHPVLAHLNDIHAMHFEKYVVWEQDGAVGFLKVHREGRSGAPGFVEHGLGPDARLIDPPLHQRDGGLMILVLGTGSNGQAACSVVSVTSAGGGSARVAPLKVAAHSGVALWPVDGSSAIVFLHDDEGKVSLLGGGRTGETFIRSPVDGLVLSQWMGSGTLGGFFLEGEFLRAFTMDPNVRGLDPRVTASYEIGQLPARPTRFAGSRINQTGGVEMLFESDRGWLVLHRGQVFALGPLPGGPITPDLIAAGGGLFLVYHDPTRGFLAELIGAAAPEPLI